MVNVREAVVKVCFFSHDRNDKGTRLNGVEVELEEVCVLISKSTGSLPVHSV